MKKRKVLIIVENAAVPLDPRVWKEAIALYQAGYGVSVLCPRRKGYEEGYELKDGVHIYRHPMPKERDGALSYIWEYAWALFFEFLYAWWIYLRRGFDVLQACNPPDDIVLVALPFKILGVKFIFDHHDANPELYRAKYEREDFLYRTLIWLEKTTFRFCDVVMSTNESYKELAITRGHVAPQDVFVVRNGPDLRTFQPVPPSPALKYGSNCLVGYVGVMGSQDGLDILLNVAEYIRNLGDRTFISLVSAEVRRLQSFRRSSRKSSSETWSISPAGFPMKTCLRSFPLPTSVSTRISLAR